MRCTFEKNHKGFLKQRESFDLEFKQSFHYGDSLAEYIRSLIGMANNKGGEIIFGIQDRPRNLVGLKNEKFENCDSNIITQFITDHFSHEIEWNMRTVEMHGLQFGRIWVQESKIKPVVCSKTYKKILREAAIYYRYRGLTREIGYPELAAILTNEREKEKKLWLQHVERIGQIGPQNIHLIDTYNGEIHTGKGKILLDKGIADKLKFIKEGEFSEVNGAPTLKLIGEVTGIVDTTNLPKLDDIYPYRFTDLKEMFGFNSFEFQAILWKLNVKGNPKYHTEITIGKKSSAHKYSKNFSQKLEALFKRYPVWLGETVEEYKKYKSPHSNAE